MSKLAVIIPPGLRLEVFCCFPSTTSNPKRARIKMRFWPALAAASLFLVIGVTSSPVQVTEPSKELLPPKEDSGPTLATDLMPPPLPKESDNYKNERQGMLFLINVYAVKNETAEESNDVLQEDVLKEVPQENQLEPLGMFLLIVEQDDENKPVSLDEVASDLMQEGFDIEKVSKDGETRLIKVNLGSEESLVKNVKVKDEGEAEEVNSKSKQKRAAEWESLKASGQLMKIRRKRHLCLKCMLGGGGGGGYYPPPQPAYQPVVVLPVYGGGGHGHHGGGGGFHHGGGGGFNHGGGGGNYYPQSYPQSNGYGQYGPGGGGGNAYAHASASASASANSYGGY